MSKRRVVITGIGAVTPLGLTAQESWEAVRQGVCGIGPITQYDPTGLKVQLAAEVKDFQPETVLDRQAAKRMGRFTQFAMVASRQAMESSGLDRAQVDLDRCGVIISSGIGGIAITEAEHERGKEKGWDRISPFYIPTTIANMAAGQVAIDTGFRGMCTCPVTACAGGTNAVGDAFRYIRDGYGEVMLCGGAESCVTPLAIGGFTSMKALSQSTDPKRASIPFDKDRNGFVMGEGAGILVLEELSHAQKRGAHIYAELVGYGATADAYHITSPCEDGSGAAKAMEIAMREAGIEPAQIDYINAHGTSTHHNDLFETRAIRLAFGAHAENVQINSTKSMIGHLLGAAGGVEAIVCVKSIQDGFVHRTAGTKETDSECDLHYTIGGPVEKKITYAMSDSLGFGGHNAVLVFKAFDA